MLEKGRTYAGDAPEGRARLGPASAFAVAANAGRLVGVVKPPPADGAAEAAWDIVYAGT
jgi:hypothetical protein